MGKEFNERKKQPQRDYNLAFMLVIVGHKRQNDL